MVSAPAEIVLRGYQSALDGVWHLWYEADGAERLVCDGLADSKADPQGDVPYCRECMDLYGDSVVGPGAGRLRIVLSDWYEETDVS